MTRVDELKRLTDQSKPISDAFSDHDEESSKNDDPAQFELDGGADKDLPQNSNENVDHTAQSRLSPPNHTEHMPPPPLSPGRSPLRSPQNSPIPESAPLPSSRVTDQRESGITDAYQHFPMDDTESWFNATGEEPVSASSSPNHSISSAGGLKKRDLRNVVDTEAEFDAALDAAVEAAYNDGYEIYDDEYPGNEEEEATKHTSVRSDDPIVQAERSRAEREAEMRAVQNRVSFHQKNRDIFSVAEDINEDEQGTDLEEEDRGPETNGAEGDNHHDPHVPRISDSSGFSGRTKGSSAASSTNTAGTSLSTVDENTSQPGYGVKLQQSKTVPSASPPTSAPPPPPSSTKPANLKSKRTTDPYESGQDSGFQNPMLIERRMSGQKKAQNLKIETALAHSRDVSEDARSHKAPTESSQDSDSKTVTGFSFGERDSNVSPDRQTSSQSRSASRMAVLDTGSPPQPSPFGSSFPSNSLSPPTPTYSGASPTTASPGKPFAKERPQMKNHSSSLSIRKAGLLGRTDTNDGSPNSPMAVGFAQSAGSPQDRLLQLNTTPMTASFTSAGSAGPIKIPYFDNDIHSPHKPGFPNPEYTNGPEPLESCPESQLLRPFWFLRCLHETLANPKGGYISNKLFIPHDVWKVKNVKLKGLEDKVAACDHLIAGLLKLGGVDTLDAEAVADEMREFESVVDNVQGTLQKKLGNEVGIKEIGTLFKDAPHMTANTASDGANNANDAGNTISGSSKSGSKSWGQSWRKLRSKSSGSTVGTPSSRGMSGFGLGGDMILSSVPMTSSLTQSSRSRSMHRKDSIPHPGKPIEPQHTGLTDLCDSPYAKYAKALAETCEAAQILDQIGRQAEDPGLKGSSEAHVGLELSSRRAAEFFALYVCRFALQDVTLLTEKYLKRASEWVLV